MKVCDACHSGGTLITYALSEVEDNGVGDEGDTIDLCDSHCIPAVHRLGIIDGLLLGVSRRPRPRRARKSSPSS